MWQMLFPYPWSLRVLCSPSCLVRLDYLRRNSHWHINGYSAPAHLSTFWPTSFGTDYIIACWYLDSCSDQSICNVCCSALSIWTTILMVLVVFYNLARKKLHSLEICVRFNSGSGSSRWLLLFFLIFDIWSFPDLKNICYKRQFWMIHIAWLWWYF